MNTFLLLLIMRGPFWGGPADCPILIKVGCSYNNIFDELYWTELFEKKRGTAYNIKDPFSVHGKINFVLVRMQAPEKYRYAREHVAFLEFLRKTQEFLFPKGVYLGYYVGRHKFYGYTSNSDTIVHNELTPGGLSLGIFLGKLPVYPYFSVIGGGSFIREWWSLSSQIGEAPLNGDTKSTGFWLMGRFGILLQIISRLSADISVTGSYLTLTHSTLENIPRAGSDKQIMKDIRVGLSLAYALPWRVVTEARDRGVEW